MIFSERKYDPALNQELLLQSVYNQAEFGSFVAPAEATLFSVLNRNADRIDHGKWIYWLVRCHNFVRTNNAAPDVRWLRTRPIPTMLLSRMTAAECFPISRGPRVVFVACGRPDRKDVLQEMKEHLKVERVFRLAVSPKELVSLHTQFEQFLG